MATRIAFSTHYPDRMGDLAGKPTYFVEKIWSGLKYENHRERSVLYNHYRRECRIITGKDWDNEYPNIMWQYPPKTTTIRKNYDYWKSKEGQLLQPFFWAGKPYRSKQVVFCPEVRLAKVIRVKIRLYEEFIWKGEPWDGELMPAWEWVQFLDDPEYGDYSFNEDGFKLFTQHEGFDDPDHFWMWFDKDMDGALLELESVEL